ncbi:MAG TPA: hypothetical protein VIK92_09950 [Thermaerobacter sp.]
MWPATFEAAPAHPVARAAAVALVAIAVKLLDDVLDREEDRAVGRPNWAARLGPGAAAYAMAALAAAATLSARDAGSLFWAGYAWGMAHDDAARLPLGLTARQESALAVVVSLATAGVADTLGALALVGSIQLLDDWLDLRGDQEAAGFGTIPRNWAGRLGRVEAFLLGCGLGLAAIARDPLQAGTAWGVAAVFMARGRRPRQFPAPPGGGDGSAV